MTTNNAINSAISLHRAGNLVEAEAIYRKILAAEPSHAGALHYFGVLMHQKGDARLAIDLIQKAIAISPHTAQFHGNLGNALKDIGQLEQAIAEYRTALQLQPGLAEVHNNLGSALTMLGRLDEAVTELSEAIRLKPTLASAHANLGNALRRTGELDHARDAIREAIRIKPDFYQANDNLGNVFKDRGELDDAISCYRRCLQLNPGHAVARSNLLYTLHFHPHYDAAALYREHRIWNQVHAEPFSKTIQPHLNDRNPERRLRIGYVSPFFREHVVSRFLLRVFGNHDPENIEVYCYSDLITPDQTTHRIQGMVQRWQNIIGESDQAVAAMIRKDQIDVLIDLSMHNSNRLLLFARKPAPVQISYLAYCSTTGMDAIGYRITDPYLDPPGTDETVYSERSLCLPETYWCYDPPVDTPSVGPLPVRTNGYITFGCLNNFTKISQLAVDTWCEILRKTPGSRMHIHAKLGSHRQRLLDRVASNQIDPSRINFITRVPQNQYFSLYNSIDIVLDPFPYSGGTTSFDGLWMGAPVVSLAGKTAVARGGLSILSNLGLADLVSWRTDDYIRIAVDLANDIDLLENLRTTMRDRMQASPLMNGPRMARHLEQAYRTAWREWCAQ